MDERDARADDRRRPDPQGQGIGHQLLAALLERAKYEGYPALSVSVQRGDSDEEAYRERGFEAFAEDGEAVTLVRKL